MNRARKLVAFLCPEHQTVPNLSFHSRTTAKPPPSGNRARCKLDEPSRRAEKVDAAGRERQRSRRIPAPATHASTPEPAVRSAAGGHRRTRSAPLAACVAALAPTPRRLRVTLAVSFRSLSEQAVRSFVRSARPVCIYSSAATSYVIGRQVATTAAGDLSRRRAPPASCCL